MSARTVSSNVIGAYSSPKRSKLPRMLQGAAPEATCSVQTRPEVAAVSQIFHRCRGAQSVGLAGPRAAILALHTEGASPVCCGSR